MNEKITLPSLVALLSAKTGKTKKQCEDFLREFFNTLVDTLSAGDNVRVKGLGTFKVIPVEPRKSVNVNTGEQMEIPGHNKIVFVPAKELAEEVNTPFAMFESVELPDDVTDAEVEEEVNEDIADNPEEIDKNEEILIVETPVQNATEKIVENYEIKEEEGKGKEEEEEEKKEETVEEEQNVNNVESTEDGDKKEEDEIDQLVEDVERVEESRKNYRFILGFACGVACAALICLGAYLFFFEKWSDIFTSEKETPVAVISESVETVKEKPMTATVAVENDSVAKEITSDPKESVKEEDSKIDAEKIAPTQPSDKKVYDTISKTRYLTTMAKEHYGNYNLWPYIYEENKAILGHPDRIRPGTKVVIPSLSKYGIDPKNPEDIRRAKNKGVEIYARYQ